MTVQVTKVVCAERVELEADRIQFLMILDDGYVALVEQSLRIKQGVYRL